VFDSGMGGLSVVKSLLEHQLFEEIIYFGDTARVPYGSKDKNTIIRYAIEAVEFFKNFELDMIIVACNSVSAYALSEMRESASCPVFGVIEAGVLATSNALTNKQSNILVLGTQATVESQSYVKRLKNEGFNSVESKATGLFVPLVEENIYSGAILDAMMNHYFKNVKTPDALILGCTHFPLISQALKNYFGDTILLIHSGEAIVQYLQENFDFSERYADTEIKFFASENPDRLKKVASQWLSI
jgi:glutamate racemase